MRLVTFKDDRGPRIGVLTGNGSEILDVCGAAPDLPANMLDLVRGGERSLAAIDKALPGARRIARSALQLLAPFPRPSKNIFCVGKNYHEHAKEFHGSGFDASAKEAIPEAPIFFTKAPGSVIANGEAIPSFLDHTNSTDYEGELAVVIGAGGRGIPAADAYDHVFGYTIVNDVTARTLQHHHRQWFLGKSLDGFCPMGPVLLTRDEVPDVRKLRLETKVNGELRQHALVGDLIFDIPTLIETLSRTMTLEPGDIIATGTCAGVGIGFKPPRFLKKGDVVSVTIEPIGTLTNPVR
jgi:2-keto-4-pentenoate hydratase/2-oxohepta-3-ene-1,7-dioic acid hydratase in catechol pathway